MDVAAVIAQLGNDIVHMEAARLDAHDLAGDAVGNHDFVEDGAGLLDGAKHVARDKLIAHPGDGHEVPDLLAVQRGHRNAAGDAVPGDGAHLGQRALDAVIDVVEHAGTELHGHRHPGGHDLGAGSETGGLLIDLDGGAIARHIQDLADQLVRAHAHNV